MRPAYELANVLNTHWPEVVRSSHFNSWQLRTLDAIRRCRTASLGGHIDLCSSCGHIRISYNSCRNRHCPKCQQIQRERWIQAREAELLPTTYFHVVFTLPDKLNMLCLYEPSKMYKLLFDTAWNVIRSFAQDEKHLGADTGMISILHTCEGKFLFPVKAMSCVFRARFVTALRNTIKGLDKSFYNDLFKTSWVIYAKRPFGGPKQVIEYLGRYTHKIAISNHRIISIAGDAVTFRYKDYRDESKNKIMTLNAKKFIRRFSLHILPKGFPRIRHYGILSSKRKQKILPLIHEQLNSHYRKAEKKEWKQISTDLGYNPDHCPVCKQQTMVTILCFDRRGPPDRAFIQSFIKTKQPLTVQQ